MKLLRALLADDEGANMAEYALVVSLVAVVCIVAVKAIGTTVSTMMFQRLSDSM